MLLFLKDQGTLEAALHAQRECARLRSTWAICNSAETGISSSRSHALRAFLGRSPHRFRTDPLIHIKTPRRPPHSAWRNMPWRQRQSRSSPTPPASNSSTSSSSPRPPPRHVLLLATSSSSPRPPPRHVLLFPVSGPQIHSVGIRTRAPCSLSPHDTCLMLRCRVLMT
jgi:hypothetical protein